jgi:membrane-associated phospholipid phosphatase
MQNDRHLTPDKSTGTRSGEAHALSALEAHVGEASARWLAGILCGLTLATSYLCVVHFVAGRGVIGWDPTIPLDRAIPAVPWAIWIYMTNLLYYFACVIFLPTGTAATKALIAVWKSMFIVIAISLTVFLICPAEVALRDQMHAALVGRGAALHAIYDGLYRLDPPFNAWPSGHVSQTLVMALFLARIWSRRPWRRLVLWIAWTTMAISIVLTKQHLLFDLVTGIALGAVAWRLWVLPHLPASFSPADDEVSGQPESTP